MARTVANARSENPSTNRAKTSVRQKVKQLQKSTKFQIARTPFENYVRELLKKHGIDRIRGNAIDVIQTAVEEIVRSYAMSARSATEASGRKTTSSGDMALAVSIGTILTRVMA